MPRYLSSSRFLSLCVTVLLLSFKSTLLLESALNCAHFKTPPTYSNYTRYILSSLEVNLGHVDTSDLVCISVLQVLVTFCPTYKVITTYPQSSDVGIDVADLVPALQLPTAALPASVCAYKPKLQLLNH